VAKTELVDALVHLLEPAAESHGFELVAVEQSGGRHTPVVRVLLDREGGLDIDAICEANGWVGELLDEADPIGGPYTLEVSSPGIDRPLRKLSDFDRFAGSTVTLKIKAEHGARSAWTGTLIGTQGESVLIESEGEQVAVAHSEIVKARLKGVVSFDRERAETP